MRRSATLLKAVFSAAAILILAAGCSSSPTAPTVEQTITAPSDAQLGLYAHGGGG